MSKQISFAPQQSTTIISWPTHLAHIRLHLLLFHLTFCHQQKTKTSQLSVYTTAPTTISTCKQIQIQLLHNSHVPSSLSFFLFIKTYNYYYYYYYYYYEMKLHSPQNITLRCLSIFLATSSSMEHSSSADI
jgi:hypothetical protein